MIGKIITPNEAASTKIVYDQIVLGAGTSALTYLYYSSRPREMNGAPTPAVKSRTLVIGEQDLWQEFDKAGLSDVGTKVNRTTLGQPKDLLKAANQPVTPGRPGDFMKVSDYVREMEDLKASLDPGIRFVKDRARTIEEVGSTYIVRTVKGREYRTEQVIVATGPGPQSIPPICKAEKIEGDYFALTRSPRPYPEVVDAVGYVTQAQPPGLSVVVYGGQPTSAWAVAHAIASGAGQIAWMARKGITDEANPVGRNDAVMKIAEERGYKVTNEIASIEALREADVQAPRLKLTLKSPLEGSKILTVHQLVYAFGADPLGLGGPGAILSQDIKAKLAPVWDRDRRFTLSDQNTAVAFVTTDKRLWVVGAAVFRNLGMDQFNDSRIGSRYASMAKIFAEAAGPPEGIALVKASLKAVTRTFEDDPNLDKFDFVMSDRAELTRMLERRHGSFFSDQTLGTIVDRFIAARTREKFAAPWHKLDEIIFGVAKEEKMDPESVRKSVKAGGSMYYKKSWTDGHRGT